MKNKFLSRIGQWHTPPYLRKCLTSLKTLTLLLVMLMSVNVWGEKITTLAGITSGNSYYIGATTSSSDSYFSVNGSSTSASIAGAAVSEKSKATVLKFTAVTGGWTIQFESGNYLGLKSSKDNGKVQVVENAVTWTIEEDANKGLLKLHPNGFYLQKNNSGAQFGSYGNTQTDVWLEEVSTTSKTLVSVAVSGSPTKTTYEAGESFDVTGLTVTGTYTEGDPEVITSGIDWTITPNPLTAGTTSVSVTAKVGEITSPAYQVNGLTVTEFVQTYANTYTSDASLSETIKGSKVKWEGCKVTDGYVALKIGKAETASITVPAGTKTVHLHMVAWNGESTAVTVKLGSTALSSITPTADAGVSGSGTTYTIATEPKTEDSYYFAIDVNADEATTLSLTTASGKRAILFGVNFEADTKPSISADVEEIEFKQKELDGTVTDSKTISATGKNLTAPISADMKAGSSSIFSVTPVGTPTAAAGEFTVSYSTIEAGEYAGTVVLSSGETSLEIPVSASVVAHIPVLQSVAVSGTPTKTDYTEGDAFETAGLTVTGTYDVGEPQPITEGISWTIDPSGALEFGTTSVNVQATVDDITSVAYPVAITVAKAPSIVTWDLTKDETATATADEISWTSDFATMIDEKGESTTPANNYYPGDKDSHTSTRFYGKSVLTITPVDNNVITKVEFTATSNGYAKALKNSTWTNATASMDDETSGKLVVVTPTDGTQAFFATIGGTCGFTAVKVYYQPGATMTSIAVKTAPKTEYNAGESFNPAGLVIIATYDDASFKDITYDANDTKWEFAPGLTDKLDATDNEVIISYNDIVCDDALEITVNRIASNLAAVSATKILVVDDAPSLADWYTIDANYDGTVAFQSDNDEVFSVEGAEGLALAAGSATLTITAPQTGTYTQASVTVAVTVNAAAVPCSVKWMNNGEEYAVGGPSTVVNAGQKVTKLPNDPAPCDAQHKFMGWTNNPIATPQAAAPSVLFTDAASAPTVDADNTVYYAVYAIESQDEDIDSYTFTGVGTVTEGVTTLTTSSGNTIRMDKGEGSNPPAWSSNQARLYAYGIMTVSSSDKISKVVYTYKKNASSKVIPDIVSLEGNNSDAGSHASETDASNVTTTTWTSSTNAAKSVVLQLGGTKGNYGFTNVTIYTAGELVYSDYSTTCAAVELDKIELSGTYPTTFLVGDEFSHEGMTVTASYTNSTTTKDVTNLATFTDKATGEAVDMSAVGSKTILVSYTEDENTKTAEYNITINDLPTMTIAQFLANPSKCYLSGIVSNITNTTYGNYTLTDASGNAEIYGTLTPSKESKQFATLGIVEGDKIKVIAENYSTQYENISDVIFVEELEFDAIVVSGTMNVTEYTEGNTLSSEGLVVKGKYADEDEATHVITEGITWNMPTAVLGTSEYDVTATVGTLTSSPAYHVTGITVNAAKVLTGITIVTEPKKTFWVGENFSTTGIQVTASYDGAEDADVTALCTFSRAETQITDAIVNETITVSYTEGTETKTATYTINANWMTLADLVENVIPTEAAVKVWVKITDALVKVRNNSYLTTDVTYGDSQTKEVKIYKSGVNATWVAGGTISGELKDVDWKLFNSDWELMPSDWTWATYTPADPTPVTGVSLSESTLKIKVGKTATLTATVTPDNATDKSVTWAIINDNANGKVTVSDAGVVSVAADATEGATATVQVKTNEGNFTATCNVTVDVPVVTKYYLVTDASTLHVGDIIVMAATYNDQSYVNGDLSGDYLTRVEATITDNVLSAVDACEFVLGGGPGAWTLTSVDGQLGATNAKKLTYDNTKDNFVDTWTITITDNVATIASTKQDGGTGDKGYGKFLYNAGSPRFLTYTSDPTATMLLPQIYHRYKETVRENVTEGTIGTMVYEHNITAIAGAVIYEPNYVSGNVLEFIEVPVEETVAGRPYIFVANGENDGKVQINFGIEEPADDYEYKHRGLVGNMGAEAIYVDASNGAYAIYQNQIRPANNTKVAVGRAYIADIQDLYDLVEKVPAAPRRRLSLGIERSMPTGFETIMMQKGMNKVIMNNQLYLIRDGKLFNAQGALVK